MKQIKILLLLSAILYFSCQDKEEQQIQDIDIPVSASFTVNITDINMGDTVQFTDQSEGEPSTWLWDFGDGSTSSEQNPSHIYTSVGIYSISLTVSNSISSDTETKNELISASYAHTYGSVTDTDGNIYKTIQIGEQEWMAQNLGTTKYNDGTDIPLVSISEWTDVSTPVYSWYDDDSAKYKADYGALYNWHVVETDKLCPSGWHVPSDDEWKELEMYLGMNQSEADKDGWRGVNNEGEKLKEIGLAHWPDPNGGTNESGFTAIPGGFCGGGAFFSFSVDGFWWSRSEYEYSEHVFFRNLNYENSGVRRGIISKQNGLSVRCVKD